MYGLDLVNGSHGVHKIYGGGQAVNGRSAVLSKRISHLSHCAGFAPIVPVLASISVGQSGKLAKGRVHLFPERVEAWANGPVVPDLYNLHRGVFFCPAGFPGADVSRLTDRQKSNIDLVLKEYGNKSPQYLVALSHSETPWLDARGDCEPGERCSKPISNISIAEYYSGLV